MVFFLPTSRRKRITSRAETRRRTNMSTKTMPSIQPLPGRSDSSQGVSTTKSPSVYMHR